MTVWIGAIVFTIGAGVFFIEKEYVAGDKVARIKLEQGKMQLERFDEDGLRKGIDLLTAVIAEFPESSYALEARYYMAEGYERLNMRDVALGKYKKLAEMPVKDALKIKVRFKIAKLQIMRNYSDEGMNQLLQLLNQTQDKSLRSEIYLEIGKYYQRRSYAKDARRNYENALVENPENREARAALGMGEADYQNSVALHGVLEKETLPEAKSEKSVPQNRGDINAGVQAFNSGKFDTAIKLLAPFANLNNSDAEEALYYIGNSYLKLKQYKNAIHNFNKAVGNSPKERDEVSYIKKGEAYYLNHQYERALKVFAFARSHYPNGKYAQIARDWESEARRMLGDGSPLAAANDIDDDDDDDDEDSDILGGVALLGDEAAPRPKKRPSHKSEEITLDDEADVTP